MFFFGLRFQSFIALKDIIQAIKNAIQRFLRHVAAMALAQRKAIFRLIILSILSMRFRGRFRG